MRVATCRFLPFEAIALFAAVLSFCGPKSFAQSSGSNIELHANKNASAAEIGLPDYPGSTLVKEGNDDNTANLGFTFGDTRFRIIVAKYTTTDTPEKVLAFYRKPLAHYGAVLECNHGKPIGASAVAQNGLACSGQNDGGPTVTDHGVSTDCYELRAGSPQQFRIVCIEESQPQSTHFWIVYIELPKDHDKAERSK
jgi:hypothetical protein